MSDIATVWSGPLNGSGDWQIAGADLLAGDDLETAVLISLFSDRVALPDDVIPDGTSDPRGWWADDPAHPIGSRLWLLARAKQTAETLASAEDYIVEALQWMIDDGVVAAVDVVVQWVRARTLGAQITLRRVDGTTRPLNFAWAWAQN